MSEKLEIKAMVSGYVVSRTVAGVTANQMAADFYDALSRLDAYLRPEWKRPGGNC